MTINAAAIISVTLILFSVIDIIGNVPIILSMKDQGQKIEAGKTALASAVIMLLFLWVGEHLLSLFGVDISSFALAGAIVLFLIGLEMVLGIHFFRDSHEMKSASIFPLAFPLIAGAGTLTTILSLKAEYESLDIAIGIAINFAIIYIVIKSSGVIQRVLGKQGVAVLRKVFGIILLAIAIKLFKSNIFVGLE